MPFCYRTTSTCSLPDIRYTTASSSSFDKIQWLSIVNDVSSTQIQHGCCTSNSIITNYPTLLRFLLSRILEKRFSITYNGTLFIQCHIHFIKTLSFVNFWLKHNHTVLPQNQLISFVLWRMQSPSKKKSIHPTVVWQCMKSTRLIYRN